MTVARLPAEGPAEYELVNFTDDAEYVLREPDGGVRVFELDSREVEVRCDECSEWTLNAIPRYQGDSWMWLCLECDAST